MAQRRDARGRFASSGGGSGGGSKKKASGAPKSKSAATRAANKATTDRLLAKGMTGTGSRLRSSTSKLYQGTKATKGNNERLWRNKESNQRNAASGEKIGAQRSTAKVRGTVSRRRK